MTLQMTVQYCLLQALSALSLYPTVHEDSVVYLYFCNIPLLF